MADPNDQAIDTLDKPDPVDETSENATLRHIPRVLIVEDTVELGEIIQAALKGMNLLTFHELRGSTALQVYQKMRPDIVLLDIGLPDMSGWRVLDTIKESQLDVRRPAIVIITAYGDPANRLMGKLQGVYSYLVKPFTLAQVRDVVRTILAESSADKPSESAASPLVK
ncbi:MAG: response regulator [Aggregatilineales bacterium]